MTGRAAAAISTTGARATARAVDFVSAAMTVRLTTASQLPSAGFVVGVTCVPRGGGGS